MTPNPQYGPKSSLARFPAEVLEAYERYRLKGDPDAIEAVVRAAVVDYRPTGSGPPPTISDDTRLFEDLAYDSVAVAELSFFFEDLFDLTISNEDILGVRTLGDLRSCIVSKIARTEAKPGPITG